LINYFTFKKRSEAAAFNRPRTSTLTGVATFWEM